jgi:WD40 repeat protein
MSSDHVLQKWEGETYLASVVFSGNGKYAAFCRLKGYNTRPNKDKLTILDLSKKTVIYDETFTCSGVSLALNHDGNVLAVEHNYLKNPTDRRYSVRLLTFNTQLPYDKKYIELEAASRAIAWSPDDSLLAVACHESDICFFDVVTNNQVHQIKAHSEITNIAFSPDGKFLATSSNWGLISVWAILPFSN